MMRLLGVLLALASSAALADDCRQLPRMHALDFWLGHWDVSQGGQLVGTNTIESIHDGCAVMEHWRDIEGEEGTSLFYYDPGADRWKQVWITNRALLPGGMKEKIEQIELTTSDRIRFQGRDRTTLTREAGGKVRQLIESTPDGGKTWRATFDAIYERVSGCDASPEAIAAAPRLLIDNDNRRDVEGVLAGYTDDAVWLSPDQPPLRGRSNLRPRYEALFHDNQLVYAAEITEARSDGALGYAWGKIRGTITPLDGSSARSVDDTFLAITRCESGQWRVARLIWSHAPR